MAERIFQQHQIANTPEYQFASKLTKRLTRDLQLFISMSAEMQMISKFSQEEVPEEDKIMLNTALYANQMMHKGLEGVGINFTFSTEHNNYSRELVVSVGDKGASFVFNEEVIVDGELVDSKERGPFQLPNNNMDNKLLIAILDWLLHRCDYPPTKLNTQYWK